MKRRELDGRLVERLGLLGGSSLCAPLLVLNWPMNGASAAQALAFAGLFLPLAVGGYWTIQMLRLLAERKNYQLGFDGERCVGETLNRLMLDGCQVFHDFFAPPRWAT